MLLAVWCRLTFDKYQLLAKNNARHTGSLKGAFFVVLNEEDDIRLLVGKRLQNSWCSTDWLVVGKRFIPAQAPGNTGYQKKDQMLSYRT